jgi:hypothetical protein
MIEGWQDAYMCTLFLLPMRLMRMGKQLYSHSPGGAVSNFSEQLGFAVVVR